MKIVSWNCNGSFREKITSIVSEDSDTFVDADIYVIQECENPNEPMDKYAEYKKIIENKIGKNYFWIGDFHYKGLGIFANDNIKFEKIETNGEFKNFLAFRVNDSFNILCVWAMDKDKKKELNPYVEMIHDFYDANSELFDENLVMCGDFNSNVVFNNKHKTKDNEGNAKDHTNLNIKLNDKGLFSVYHELTNEENGNESQKTFFQARHLNISYYLDYVYANKEIIENTTLTNNGRKVNEKLSNEFEILDHWKWISLSDHLPLVFKFD